MATLAEMLGGVDFPVRAMPQSNRVLMEDDSEPALMRSMDGEEMALMARMVDLEKGILMQSAIGK